MDQSNDLNNTKTLMNVTAGIDENSPSDILSPELLEKQPLGIQ